MNEADLFAHAFAVAGVFPRLFLTFAVLDAVLAIGAWTLLGRE
jgi:hypothetical protein